MATITSVMEHVSTADLIDGAYWYDGKRYLLDLTRKKFKNGAPCGRDSSENLLQQYYR